jgi:hypothetical protein
LAGFIFTQIAVPKIRIYRPGETWKLIILITGICAYAFFLLKADKSASFFEKFLFSRIGLWRMKGFWERKRAKSWIQRFLYSFINLLPLKIRIIWMENLGLWVYAMDWRHRRIAQRNLALAEKKNLNVMTLCKCCYGSLKKADYLMKENASLKKEVNSTLEKEGLKVEGKIEIKHLLSVLHKEIGIEAIKGKMAMTFKRLKIATHYGCHALRGSGQNTSGSVRRFLSRHGQERSTNSLAQG